MTLFLIAVGLWLSPAVVVLVAWLRTRLVESPGQRALREDIEVMRLEFAWSLPPATHPTGLWRELDRWSEDNEP